MHVTVAEAYTSKIVYLLQDNQYPNTEALLVTDEERNVSPDVYLAPGATAETTQLHWTETIRVDYFYAEQRPASIESLTQYEAMWIGAVGCISEAEILI